MRDSKEFNPAAAAATIDESMNPTWIRLSVVSIIRGNNARDVVLYRVEVPGDRNRCAFLNRVRA